MGNECPIYTLNCDAQCPQVLPAPPDYGCRQQGYEGPDGCQRFRQICDCPGPRSRPPTNPTYCHYEDTMDGRGCAGYKLVCQCPGLPAPPSRCQWKTKAMPVSNCPEIVGTICEDTMCRMFERSQHCRVWAEQGRCASQAEYMASNCACSCKYRGQTTAARSDPTEPIIGWHAKAACIKGHNDVMPVTITTDSLFECINNCNGISHCRSVEWRKSDGMCTRSTRTQQTVSKYEYFEPCYNVAAARAHTWFAVRTDTAGVLPSACGILEPVGSPFAEIICRSRDLIPPHQPPPATMPPPAGPAGKAAARPGTTRKPAVKG